MDSTVRLFTKSLTWQLAGLISMMGIGYLFTGSLIAGGSIAIVGSVTGFVSYFLHELIWSKVKWGQKNPGPEPSISSAGLAYDEN